LKRKKIKRILQAEKIAAGEVVERPANIVKELIENSIDARAKEIKVIVKKAGKILIQVIDNGEGIHPDEIEFAFKRHTSSKIRSIEDLDSLSTLGFRGEALASIAAVSQVEIISRTQENKIGTKLIIEGGIVKDKKEISCSIGTNIKVKNIFYNIPARQKFLKSDATELGHITDILQRYALAYPEIHFIYRHNEIDILNCPANNNLKATVFHIYGKKEAKFMEEINYKEGKDFKLYGLIGHPQIAKKNRSNSSLFINKRYVISDLLFRAIKEAYKGTLMIGKNPFFILFIELKPSFVDFNVHPKKLYIRFENEENIQNTIYNAIRRFVEEKFITKEAKYIAAELNDFIDKKDRERTTLINTQIQETEKPILEIRERKKQNSGGKSELINSSVQLNLTDLPNKINSETIKLPDTLIRDKFIISKNFPKLKLISYTGQLSNKVYIVLEGINEEINEAGMYILDQHAASERINKEKLLNAYETSKIKRQHLIEPLKINTSPGEKIFLEENIKEIQKLGFRFEHFGGTTFILREIPIIMEKLPNIHIIKEIISDIVKIGKDKSFSEAKEEIINYLACHRSIRGGDSLSLKEIRNLLIELSNCKDPYHCAHGRPTLRFISFKELDKLFKRIT